MADQLVQTPEEIIKSLKKEVGFLKRSLSALQVDCEYLRISYAHAEQMRAKNAREKELQETYNSFFLNNHPQFVAIFDTELRFVFGSPSVWKFLGLPQGAALTFEPFRSLFLYAPQGEGWLDGMESILRGVMVSGEPVRREEVFRKVDGEEVIVQTLAMPITNREASCIGVSLIHNDITEITTAKENAEEASRVKAEFLANMSHEIRTPLNAIIGIAHIALNDEVSAKTREQITKISHAGQALLGIVNDILDFSKIEAGKFTIVPAPFRLRGFLDTIHTLFEHKSKEKGLDLIVDIGEGVPDNLSGDTLRLTQIFNNIIGNSLKFTENGSITVSCRARDVSDAGVTLDFAVTDTGIGIKNEYKAHLFQPFTQADASHTRNYGGTGLGLTITRHLVEMMGGTISAESESGIGTTIRFSCVLGLLADKEETPVVADRPGCLADALRARLEGRRILLVEDNLINQEIALALLEDVGLAVTVANNGEEAVAVVREQTALPPFDLVLMDLQMPVMDGFEATRLIRKTVGPEAMPIIAMTAHVLGEERVRCAEAGMVDHIAKPIDVDRLYAAIDQYLA
ncbi:putative Histidine kinase [uncultured delta proteobacterium]|uniref:Sensory/regulatory protein RpfC n=1 Tax=uncultured delta proteobacterium TaxID=34034 RepID=A0A212J8L1_9DELT|nr:putative Histidine kinase [uncultured delta proteobacterium]